LRIERLIEAESFDVTPEVAQRVKTFPGAGTRIPDQIIETVFASDDDKMGHATLQSNPHNHRIPMGEIGVNEPIGRKIFIDVPDSIRGEPSCAVPVNPALICISTNCGQEPIQLLGIGVDPIRFEYHGGRGNGAAFTAYRAIIWNTAQRVIAPMFVCLAKRRYGKLETVKEIAPTMW